MLRPIACCCVPYPYIPTEFELSVGALAAMGFVVEKRSMQQWQEALVCSPG